MEYEVVWGEAPLGLTLRPDRGKNMPPVVGRITRAGSTAAHAKVAVGDTLVGINGVDTTGQGYDHVVHLLQKIPRPATLPFRVPHQRSVDTSSPPFFGAHSSLSPGKAKGETKERHLSVAQSVVSAEKPSDSKPSALDESRHLGPQQPESTKMRQHGASDIRHATTQESDESEDESRDGTPPLVAFDALRRNLLRLVGVSESEPAILDTRPEYSTHTIEIDSIPTEPVPEATTTAFHDVQPKLESLVGAQETYRLVRESIAEYAFEYRCFSDWTITAGVLVVGEELEITIAVLRVASSNTSVVDFRLLQGDDMHFLRLVSAIQTPLPYD